MSGRELRLLTEGSIELLGLIPRSSNQTFLVQVTGGEDVGYAVYKPEAGERPLSDFEPGPCTEAPLRLLSHFRVVFFGFIGLEMKAHKAIKVLALGAETGNISGLYLTENTFASSPLIRFLPIDPEPAFQG